MRWMAAVALALACVLAHAHAVVLSSQPAIGATLKESAVSVELRFNSRIDSRHSRSTSRVLNETITIETSKVSAEVL